MLSYCIISYNSCFFLIINCNRANSNFVKRINYLNINFNYYKKLKAKLAYNNLKKEKLLFKSSFYSFLNRNNTF